MEMAASLVFIELFQFAIFRLFSIYLMNVSRTNKSGSFCVFIFNNAHLLKTIFFNSNKMAKWTSVFFQLSSFSDEKR